MERRRQKHSQNLRRRRVPLRLRLVKQRSIIYQLEQSGDHQNSCRPRDPPNFTLTRHSTYDISVTSDIIIQTISDSLLIVTVSLTM